MQIQAFIPSAWEYITKEIEEVVSFLPEWLAKLVAEFGAGLALDATNAITKPFSSQHFYQELRGLSECMEYLRFTLVFSLA